MKFKIYGLRYSLFLLFSTNLMKRLETVMCLLAPNTIVSTEEVNLKNSVCGQQWRNKMYPASDSSFHP